MQVAHVVYLDLELFIPRFPELPWTFCPQRALSHPPWLRANRMNVFAISLYKNVLLVDDPAPPQGMLNYRETTEKYAEILHGEPCMWFQTYRNPLQRCPSPYSGEVEIFDRTPVSQISAAQVRWEYATVRGDDVQWIVPRIWQGHPKGGWPLEGEHREIKSVPNWEVMVRMNRENGYSFCFCLKCSMQRAKRASLAGVSPNHMDWPGEMIELMEEHFCTVARVDGVYAEARALYADYGHNMEMMISRPVRSTVYFGLSSFAAL